MRNLIEALQVVGAALVFFLVVFVLDRAELQLVSVRQSPQLVLRVVAGAGFDLATNLIDQSLDLRIFPAKDDRLLVLLDREPAEQRGLSAPCSAAIEQLIGLAEIGIGLRADIGNKVTAFGGFERGGFYFVAVFVRQSAETTQDFVKRHAVLQPVALNGVVAVAENDFWPMGAH